MQRRSLLLFASLARARHVAFFLRGTHQPAHAIDGFQPKITRTLRQAAAKTDPAAYRRAHAFDSLFAGTFLVYRLRQLGGLRLQLRQQRHHGRVITVQHRYALLAKDMCFVLRVCLHAAVPIQMVLRNVQHRCSRGFKYRATVQLKARQFQHPALRQRISIQCSSQRIEQGRADIARHSHCLACALQQLSRQLGDRGFAIGAGNAQNMRCIVARLPQIAQSVHEQVKFPTRPKLAGLRRLQDRFDIGWAQTGADKHGTHVGLQ